MPSGRKRARVISRGKMCRVCGADAWRVTRTSSASGRPVYDCHPCHLQRTRAWNHQQSPAKALHQYAKKRAKKTGVPFTITVDDVEAVWPSDNICPVLGMPLTSGPGKAHDASPTLDRLVNAWGYEPGNIAVVSYAANRAKGNMRARDLERVAAWMRAQGLD